MGRWKSEGVKDGYVEDVLEKRLIVSKEVYFLSVEQSELDSK